MYPVGIVLESKVTKSVAVGSAGLLTPASSGVGVNVMPKKGDTTIAVGLE